MILTTSLSAVRNLAMANLITSNARERISAAVRPFYLCWSDLVAHLLYSEGPEVLA